MREDPTSAPTAQTHARSVVLDRIPLPVTSHMPPAQPVSLMALAGLVPLRPPACLAVCRPVGTAAAVSMRDRAAVAGVGCGRCSGPRGSGNGSGWPRRSETSCPPAPRRPGRLASADNPAGPRAPAGCRSRRGRPQRPGAAGLSAALSAVGCGPVRTAANRTAAAVSGVRGGGGPVVVRPDGGVRCYRKRSPGRRPLVGAATAGTRVICRASRSRSWPRTSVMAGAPAPGPPPRSARHAAGP